MPEKTTKLSPFARVQGRTQHHNVSKSALRALAILELLISAGRPLRAIEIARFLDMSPSSADQILKTMMDSGYLIFDVRSKCYVISIRLGGLGDALRASYFDPKALDRLVRSVQRASGEVVMLAASQGLYMQVLDICAPPESERREPKALRVSGKTMTMKGNRFSVFGSCSGAAWLASQSEDTILRAIRKCRRELGKRADDVAGILTSIRSVREQGYGYGGLMTEDGIEAVAVSLPPAPNGIVLVLIVAAPTDVIETRRDDIASMMKARINRYLGANLRRTAP